MLEIIQWVITSFTDMIVCIIYYDLFLGPVKASVKKSTFIGIYILMELSLYINVFCSGFISGAAISAISMTVSLLSLFIVSLLYNATLKQRIFSVIGFQIIAIISEIVSFSLLSTVYEVIFGQKAVSTPFLLSKFIMLFLVYIIKLLFGVHNKNISDGYTARLLIDPTLTLVILFCLWNSKEASSEEIQSDTVAVLIINICLAAINFINYVMVKNDILNSELQRRKLEIERTLKFQEEKFKQMSEHYKELRSLVHDNMKHDRYILSCVNNKDYDSISTYITTDLDGYTEKFNIIDSHNLVIDVLTNNYIKKCQNENIKFTYSVQINSKKITVSDYDMNIMLGNIFENAVNAVKALPQGITPYINISIVTDDSHLVIHEQNPCTESGKFCIYPEEQYRSLGFEKHGYGIYNIYSASVKNDGIATFEIEENVFNVRIVIPLKPAIRQKDL